MSDINTGGPAFPVNQQLPEGMANLTPETGMTLRDYFATTALQGICASGPTADFSNERLAIEAYDLADAMLKARNV